MSNPYLVVRSLFVGRVRLTFLCLVLTGVAVIAYAHFAHILGALPYVLLLVCPLAHLFMMHGHGGHDYGPERTPDRTRLPPR